jgi:multidrug transporter EmrE-like cation transporter
VGENMKNILLILTSVSLNATAQILMRRGMLKVGEISFGDGVFLRAISVMLSNVLLWFSLLCYGLSIIIWMAVLSRVEVSFAYAFSSLGYVLVTVMGVVLLKENISILRVIGILVVCIGIILVARGSP